MSNRVIYINGQYLPESEAKVSIYDSALLFGDMVFEMTRSFNGVHFKLAEHIDRLAASMKALRIPERNEILQACLEVAAMNDHGPDEEHRLMINVSRGPLGIYKGVKGLHDGPTVCIADFPLSWTTRGMGRLFDSGLHAVTPSQRQIPSRYLDPKLKHRSRLHLQRANQEVSILGDLDAWALLLDDDGFITEGTGANFFIVKDGITYTPEPRNILRGISRQYVMDKLCVTIEKNIEPYDVITADEAFFTATPFCALPVTKFNGQKIGDGEPGFVYHDILRRWSENVGVNIKAQIQAWDAAGVEAGSSPYVFKA